MSDEQEPVTDVTSEDHDSLLQLMCSMAEGGLNFGVSLFVGGALVTGTLISRRQYLEKWTGNFAVAAGGDVIKELRDAFGLDKEQDESATKLAVNLRYIHLSEARVTGPGGSPMPDNGMLWRGKIKDVNAFSMGQIRAAN